MRSEKRRNKIIDAMSEAALAAFKDGSAFQIVVSDMGDEKSIVPLINRLSSSSGVNVRAYRRGDTLILYTDTSSPFGGNIVFARTES